jgi:hypothetical protein
MLARIGHVFGWTGDILGGLFVLGGLAKYFEIYEWIASKLVGGPRPVTDPVILKQLENWSNNELLWKVAESRKAELETLILLLVAGVLFFLVGRALRYVLAGPKQST